MLGAPVRAVVVDYEMEAVLRKRAKLESRRGIGCDYATIRFQSGNRGHQLALGAELYRVDAVPRPIRIVRVLSARNDDTDADAYYFWAVAEADYRRLYGLLRRAVRRRARHAEWVCAASTYYNVPQAEFAQLVREAKELPAVHSVALASLHAVFSAIPLLPTMKHANRRLLAK
jgi:hypothetical protein